MPSREDKLRIKREKLLTMLEKEPRPAGKSKRLDKTYLIDKSEMEKAKRAFKMIK